MRIAFLGDSLTEGWPGSSYFARLPALLPGHELANRGRAGDTVVDLDTRIRREGLEPADVVFVWVGVNDAFVVALDPYACELGDDGLDAGFRRLAHVYDDLLAFVAGRAAAVVSVPPVLPDEGVDEPWRARVVLIADVVRETAARRAAAFLDLDAAFEAAVRRGRGGPFTIDGVHLSARGADVVAAAFAAAVRATGDADRRGATL